MSTEYDEDVEEKQIEDSFDNEEDNESKVRVNHDDDEDDEGSGSDINNDSEVDSSEEEDDDDEEEAEKIRKGFIVDDDEESEEEAVQKKRKRHKKKLARNRSEENDDEDNVAGESNNHEEYDSAAVASHRRHRDDDVLDEDDLDLLLENTGAGSRPKSDSQEASGSAGRKFKRLKRAEVDTVTDEVSGDEEILRQSSSTQASRGLTDIFSEEEEEDIGASNFNEDRRSRQLNRGQQIDEFDGFIEEDEFSDDMDDEDNDARRRAKQSRSDESNRRRDQYSSSTTSQLINAESVGIDDDKLGEIYEIFGNGAEYAWVLETEEQRAKAAKDGVTFNEDGESAAPELKNVFEPSELKQRLMTDEDNVIRSTDEPERYQLLRSAVGKAYNLNDIDFRGEQEWVFQYFLKDNNKIALLKQKPHLEQPLRESVYKITEFISKDLLEVPFIYHHRREYMSHAIKKFNNANGGAEQAGEEDIDYEIVYEELLNQHDLWRILQLDIEYHGIFSKRKMVEKTYVDLKISDPMLDQFLLESQNLLDYQDALDYVQFRYSAQLRDVLSERAAALNLDDDDEDNNRTNVDNETDQPSKRHSRFGRFERIRASQIYKLVRAFGMSSEQFGENLDAKQRIYFAEDPAKSPSDLTEEVIVLEDEEIVSDHKQALDAAQSMYVEEIYMDPRVRKFVRAEFERKAVVDVVLTERGRKRIDESSPFFDFKYACNLTFGELKMKPELYLRMLLAEGQGLIEIRFNYPEYKKRFILDNLLPMFGSDGVSDIANAWNEFRLSVLSAAMKKTVPLICRNIKENLKKDCELALMLSIRKNFLKRLNQAPYKPNDYELGTIPRVLSISAGMGDFSKDAILAVYIDEDSRIIDRAKLGDPRSEDFKNEFVELVTRRKPDVIGLSGFSVSSEKLYGILKNIIEENHLKSSDEETADNQQQPNIELIWVQDEVARLYQNSKRAELEFPDSPSLERYLISLARYVQSPLLEYAALGSEISGIPIHPHQHLLSEDLFKTATDSCFVDMVNLVGVDINDAVRDTYIANLLQYISGLGPRKSSSMLQGIQSHGGSLSNRTELVTEGITGKNIFINCASFLKIPYDKHTLNKEDTEMLDATRIHPEDYELARKMAGDALELDEEDLVDIENTGGVISHLINEGSEKLNDLILSGYAEELERKLNQKKYITLEMIKEELQNHYNEQRHEILKLTDMEIFTMLTGETNTSLHVGSVIPVNIKRIADRYVSVKLSSGLNGNIKSDRMSDKNNIPHPSTIFHFGQTVRAVVLSIDYKTFSCELSTREREVEEAVKAEARNRIQMDPRNWNYEAEDADRQRIAVKRDNEQRSARVIKHPLFRMFNSKQAEEFLAPLSRGDMVIRPSSRGFDHIAITWKVADQIFQHVDVLELEKANEYSLGKFLQIGNKRYSDLDELIVLHIKSMARKVDEMTSNDKFRKGGKTEAEEYLRVYLLANPKRSAYTFCFDHKNPGYFYLCFQVNGSSPVQFWHVKVIPNGYYLLKSEFPDVTSLCNGFKTIYQAKMAEQKAGFGGGQPQGNRQNQQSQYNNGGFYGQQPPQGPQAHYQQQPRYDNHDSNHGGNNGGYYNGGNGGHNNDGHRYR